MPPPGKLKPASPLLRSDQPLLPEWQKPALTNSKIRLDGAVADYDLIRELIEQTIPGFDNYNDRIRVPGGFRMPLPPTERVWPTSTGKAMFSVFHGVNENVTGEGENTLRLITLRSHDQYNTTIYAMDDRYRGVFGRRDIIFMNEGDMEQLGLDMAIASISERPCLTAISAWKISPSWPTALRQVLSAPIIPRPMFWFRSIILIKRAVRLLINPYR